MKKLLAIILSLVLVVSLAACGTSTEVNDVKDNEEVVETNKTEETPKDEAEKEEVKEEVKEDNKKEEPKKEESKKEDTKPAEKNEEKPAEKEEVKPAEKNEEKPSTPSTLGTTLLADFKAKANAGMGAQEIAEGLMTNPAIKFAGGAMPIEEGYLSGFDNVEIKGFKNGVMFAPMIGSIAFVGYIFELDNASEVSAFISTLEKNANKRWNICVEADEMVTGSVGNKVFFVMCPTSLEE